MEKRTPFGRMSVGQLFNTANGIKISDGMGFKRAMTCVKVAPMETTSGHIVNAVILLDHTGKAAYDIGKLVHFERADTFLIES